MKSIKVHNHLSQRGPLFNLLRHSALFSFTYSSKFRWGLLIMKARSVKILPVTELLIASKAWMQVINFEHKLSRASHRLPMFFKVKEEKEIEVCTAVHKPLMSKSVWQTALISMTATVYYSDTSVRKQTTYAKPRLVFNTVVTPCAYLNTNRQYLLCTKAPGAQKDRLPGAKFLLDFLASPCLGPAARKISQEKRVDKASKNKLLTWPSHHLRVSENVAKQNQDSNSTSLVHYCRLISNIY